MTDTAPPVVTRYLAAATAAEFAVLAECFETTGTVVDEGRTYHGRDEIVGWRESLANKWVFTTTVTASEPIDADSYRVKVRVEGNFPGGVADLTYRFSLRDDLIVSLSIVE
jgi:hypothetical protein